MSDWNRYIERLLAADLGVEEYRLALALGRSLLGFRKRAEHFGRDLLMEASGLTDKRSFERARAGLVAKQLLHYESSGPGRGKRSLYALLLDADENAADERPFEEHENAAEARPFRPDEKAAENAAENAAQERPRIEKGEGRSKDVSASPLTASYLRDAHGRPRAVAEGHSGAGPIEHTFQQEDEPEPDLSALAGLVREMP